MLEYSLAQHTQDPQLWAQAQMQGATLGDTRRQRRAVHLASAMARDPQASLPRACATHYATNAAYVFLDRPETTPDNLQAGHRELVRQRAAQPGQLILQLEDTTDLSWAGGEPITGLGPLGQGSPGLQGFRLHSVLSVLWPAGTATPGRRPPVELLGLSDQQYLVRTPAPPEEKTRPDTRAIKKRWRESQLWTQASWRLGPAPAGVRWVRVCDREADIYEFLQSCQALGHGFVVRAGQDRALEEEAGPAAGHLFETVRGARTLGHVELHLRARPGQRARTAQLALAACPVRLRSPWRPGQSPGAGPALACWAVRVFEPHPPAGVRPLEWILLSDAPVASFEQAQEVALQYSCRWLMEEFHKALKSGTQAEALQLETAERLFAAVALKSLVALRLIELRERVRRLGGEPAEGSGLSRLELEVLRRKTGWPLLTVAEVGQAIGRLGGHLGRKGDGPPGWKTLMLGMERLQWIVEGVRLAQAHSRFEE
jgi:hypothetical protein